MEAEIFECIAFLGYNQPEIKTNQEMPAFPDLALNSSYIIISDS